MKREFLIAEATIEIENNLKIDAAKLIKNLAARKGRKLTKLEQYYLCRSLLGDEPVDIARSEYYKDFYSDVKKTNHNLAEKSIQKLVEEKIKIKAAIIRSNMSRTINSYISELMYEKPEKSDQCDQEKRQNWLKIVHFLIRNGYRKEIELEQEEWQNKKILVLEAEGNLELKNIVQLLQDINQKFGSNSLTIRAISQEGG